MFVRGKNHDSDYKTLKELHAPAVFVQVYLFIIQIHSINLAGRNYTYQNSQFNYTLCIKALVINTIVQELLKHQYITVTQNCYNINI
jgi:hypothetical protein